MALKSTNRMGLILNENAETSKRLVVRNFTKLEGAIQSLIRFF